MALVSDYRNFYKKNAKTESFFQSAVCAFPRRRKEKYRKNVFRPPLWLLYTAAAEVVAVDWRHSFPGSHHRNRGYGGV